jgi:hypothetical protein
MVQIVYVKVKSLETEGWGHSILSAPPVCGSLKHNLKNDITAEPPMTCL